jgi:hypothetical protein
MFEKESVEFLGKTYVTNPGTQCFVCVTNYFKGFRNYGKKYLGSSFDLCVYSRTS